MSLAVQNFCNPNDVWQQMIICKVPIVWRNVWLRPRVPRLGFAPNNNVPVTSLNHCPKRFIRYNRYKRHKTLDETTWMFHQFFPSRTTIMGVTGLHKSPSRYTFDLKKIIKYQFIKLVFETAIKLEESQRQVLVFSHLWHSFVIKKANRYSSHLMQLIYLAYSF